MATAAHILTKEQFRQQFTGVKPNYEYWFGEAVQKPMGTWLHSALQVILAMYLKQAGYYVGTELALHSDPAWEPVPDVVGLSTWPSEAYPIGPVDVVIEILSPDDRMSRVLDKCREYARIGTGAIFWIDPISHAAWIWDSQKDNLERVNQFDLPNGKSILVKEVMDELARQKFHRD